MGEKSDRPVAWVCRTFKGSESRFAFLQATATQVNEENEWVKSFHVLRRLRGLLQSKSLASCEWAAVSNRQTNRRQIHDQTHIPSNFETAVTRLIRYSPGYRAPHI